ncbi:MAG TPA: hypothetical protein VFN97_00320, partial [Actinospica sp.]|nr:hypothetical protein [Actinospica sp.]
MASSKIKTWLALGTAATFALVAVPSTASASTESLSVNLASTQGAMTGVGQGFLYGLSQDG